MATGRQSIWRRIRGHTTAAAKWAALAAWGCLVGLTVWTWVFSGSVFEARVAWHSGDGRALQTIEVDCVSGELLVGSERINLDLGFEYPPPGVTLRRLTWDKWRFSWGWSFVNRMSSNARGPGPVRVMARDYGRPGAVIGSTRGMIIPDWVLIAVSAVVPAAWWGWKEARRSRRRKRGL